MNKIYFVFLIFIFLFGFSTGIAQASLVTVGKNGELVVNVLALEGDSLLPAKRESLTVKKLANSQGSSSNVSLVKNGDGVSLVVNQGGGQEEIDVTDFADPVVEIEERDEADRVDISVVGSNFAIKQREVVALTSYPISIDAKSVEFLVRTETGDRVLSVLPLEAAQVLVRSKTITNLGDGGTIKLTESDQGELLYEVSGQKILNILNILDYPVEVKSQVSATTGEILSVNQPPWLFVASYLLS